MGNSIVEPAFVAGELSPSIFGRVDLPRLHIGAATMRNMFVSYRGGAYSRAGTAFVGFSLQTGRTYPPRLINFQFSVNQGLALEFGNYYMRVISNGGYVTETPLPISNVTNASPAVITISYDVASSATPVTSGVVQSYQVGEYVTLAGGTYTQPAILHVTATKVLSASVVAAGTGYAPGNTITLAGGTQTSAPSVTVSHTQVVSATVASGGSGGTNGTQTVTGTTGTGTKFQASVTVAGGAITAVLSIITGGSYTTNPSSPSNEPVTGASLSGAALNVVIGVKDATLTASGGFTANPTNSILTQSATSGSGSGAQFAGLFAPNSVVVSTPGVYATDPSNPVSQSSSTGTGLGCQFNLSFSAGSGAPYATGDWVEIAGIAGLTQLNGGVYVLTSTSGSSYSLHDVYGNPIDTTSAPAYVSGGTAAKIYTLATPYAEADLKWLKFTQSADVMSICCVNQLSATEYEPQDLTRFSDTNWAFSPVIPASPITPPSGTPTGVATDTGTVDYAYQVTAVDPVTGSESVASDICYVNSAVNIASTAGSIAITWNAVPNINEYNVYKAQPLEGTTPPVGALFGYAGSTYGTRFVDNNIVAGYAQVPPLHKNPFARGQIVACNIISSTNDFLTATATVNSLTGSGAVLRVAVNTSLAGSGGTSGGNLTPSPGPVAAIIVENPGFGYQVGDTVTITGDGSSAQANLVIGPQSGTYPSVPFYFQERRGYANSLNNPDTYWMSQPGAFKNFDVRIPTIDSDAITGSPWAQQVNGLQAAIQTSGGLLVLTGLSAWLLAGPGTFATNVQAISPANQVANPQAFTGCSPTVPPIKINYDVLYVQSKGSYYLDLPYQLYTLSEPIDITEASSHLFVNYTILEHAWCEQPYKVVWSIRNDGVALSLTWYKSQQVAGWARHDTNGSFVSVCSVTEPPVDAPYFAVQRLIAGNMAYTIERMDNRLWQTVEDAWCVDCGLRLPQPEPGATINASSSTGLGAITGVTDLVGGSGYSAATYATVIDDKGEGSGTGAVPNLTITNGVITAITFAGGQQGSGYTYPAIEINDPAGSAGGSGASARCVLDNSATFTTTSGVFSSGDVGSIIRMGGGVAEITSYASATEVVANILSPIVEVIPNSGGLPQWQESGNWTMTAPVQTVGGLYHLRGAYVVGLADGNVVGPLLVSQAGTVTLPKPASAITLGIGYQAQLQSVYLDAGSPTIQGQRKKVSGVTVRLEDSRGVEVGNNQPDGSTLSPPQNSPEWEGLTAIPDLGRPAYNALCVPLYTGDTQKIPVKSDFGKPGQIAVEQNNPLPMNVLAFVPDFLPGDVAQQAFSQKPKGRQG